MYTMQEFQKWSWGCSCGARVIISLTRPAKLRPPGAKVATALWQPPNTTIVRGLHSLEEMRRLAE